MQRNIFILILVANFLAFAGFAAMAASPVRAIGQETQPKPAPRRAVVDASHHGGVWWSPQGGAFNTDQPHQGAAFAKLLKGAGCEVQELSRDAKKLDFSKADVVVRFVLFGKYTPADVAAYRKFVERGGCLILVQGIVRDDRPMPDEVAAALGFSFAKMDKQDKVRKLEPHEITAGLESLPFNTGSVIFSRPKEVKPLAYADGGEVVMAEAVLGKGRVIAVSTPFALLQAPERFAAQLLGAVTEQP